MTRRDTSASSGRPKPTAASRATVSAAASILPPHPFMTAAHSGKPAGAMCTQYC